MIRNKVDGKCYIGQTIQKISKRWGQHTRPYSKCIRLRNAIQKYGKENFEFSIICDLPNEDLIAREILEICERNTMVPNGYNLTSGGEGCKASEETRKKISEAHKGRKHTEESIKNMSEGQKGKKMTEETRKRMSEVHKGSKASEKTRRKISDNSSRARGVKQLSLNGDLIAVFESIKKAGETLGISFKAISNCCRGKTKTSGSFKWEYSITL